MTRYILQRVITTLFLSLTLLTFLPSCAHRVPAPASIEAQGRRAVLRNTYLSGIVHDNLSNRDRSGSGWNPLTLKAYPTRNLFRDDFVGLNFEHIFNGTAADREISMFTPRKDPCYLEVHGTRSVTLHWPAEHSAWSMDCRMTYTLRGSGVDIDFRAIPRHHRFPLGYAAMMWASYMGRTRDRAIHFYGVQDGVAQWLSFGHDTADGMETGTIRHANAMPLPYENGAQLLNLVEHPEKAFLDPFYFGLIDADGDLATQDDTQAYVMMFDQRENIRFALWNFIKNAEGNPDPHSPAWDWQFVIRAPEVGREYGYRARMEVIPWEGREAVRSRYEEFRRRAHS